MSTQNGSSCIVESHKEAHQAQGEQFIVSCVLFWGQPDLS
jgi:hypothetical protein